MPYCAIINLFDGFLMFINRWLDLKGFIFCGLLFLVTTMVAESDTSIDPRNSSSKNYTTNLVIYGLVGSNLLNKD